MTTFLIHNMAPLMFAGLIVVMLLGYPVAFALAAVGIGFGLLGIELGLLQATLFQALPERIWGVMSNDTLLAIPFFTFMGLILERSGMAEDLLETIGQLFGAVRGGLAYAVIFVGALLAATTGVVAASVISMGLISLPIMLRYGYDRRFASGVDRRVRHARADHPAVARAHHHGGPIGEIRRRHVCGRVHPRLRADRPLRLLHVGRLRVQEGMGAGVAGGSADAEGTGRIEREPVADRAVRDFGRRGGGLREMVLPSRRAARRTDRRRDLRRYRRRVLHGADPEGAQVPTAVEARRARGVRADSGAGADLPRAGHDLPWRRDAHGGRRDGRDRRADHGVRPPTALA